MATAESEQRSWVGAPLAACGSAFGLTVEARTQLPALAPSISRRRVEWRLAARGELDPRRPRRSKSLRELRHPDGQLFMSIEQSGEAGYVVAAPGFGEHRISSDGSLIRSNLPEGGDDRWQRLFFAQALPLAAVVHGLSLLHASAVVLGGRAYALVAESGVGKSSTAAQLIAAGGDFVTDDVLALEPEGAGVLVHPGPARLSLDRAQLGRLGPLAERVGRVLEAPTEDDKVQLATRPVSGPAPLAGVFVLSVDRAQGGLSVQRDPANRTRALLGAAFLGYLDLSPRLALHLEVCARIARELPTFSVRRGMATTPREVAQAVSGVIESLPHTP
jgi:hypothetical protein